MRRLRAAVAPESCLTEQTLSGDAQHVWRAAPQPSHKRWQGKGHREGSFSPEQRNTGLPVATQILSTLQEGGTSMNRFPEPVQRRQTLIRRLGLVAIGIGRCPICQQRTEVFARRSATPGPTRECCLVCWIVPRYARGQSNKRQRISRWAEQPRQQNGASMMAAKAKQEGTWLVALLLAWRTLPH